MTHDQSVDWLIETREKITKQKVVDFFLASLSSKNLKWRSGLPAYAMSVNFPIHTFRSYSEIELGTVCPVCDDYIYFEQERQIELIELFRITTGGILQVGNGAFIISYYLDQIMRLEDVFPKDDDIIIFNNIIEIIRNAKEDDGPNDIEKKIGQSKFFKSNKEQRRALLESLAICGIMETNEHKGYFQNFNDSASLNQRKNGPDIDWGYPIRWWKGKDKINEIALKFWFGFF